MKVLFFKIAAISLVIGLSSCQSNKSDSQNIEPIQENELVQDESEESSSPETTPREITLTNVLWETIAIAGYDAVIPEDNNPSIAIVGERVAGTTACNRYSGTYVLNNENLSFDPMAATKMACMGELGDIESAFLSAMDNVASYQISEKELLLSDSNNELLITLKFVQFIDLK